MQWMPDKRATRLSACITLDPGLVVSAGIRVKTAPLFRFCYLFSV
jgi:hypothetical protein